VKNEGMLKNPKERLKIPDDPGLKQLTVDLRCSIEDEKRIETGIQHAILNRLRAGMEPEVPGT
jgi:hypothetical protein